MKGEFRIYYQEARRYNIEYNNHEWQANQIFSNFFLEQTLMLLPDFYSNKRKDLSDVQHRWCNLLLTLQLQLHHYLILAGIKYWVLWFPRSSQQGKGKPSDELSCNVITTIIAAAIQHLCIHNWSLQPLIQSNDLAFHTIFVVCVNCIHECRNLQFKIDSERQIF